MNTHWPKFFSTHKIIPTSNRTKWSRPIKPHSMQVKEKLTPLLRPPPPKKKSNFQLTPNFKELYHAPHKSGEKIYKSYA